MKVVHEITTFTPPAKVSRVVPRLRQTRNDPGEPRDNPVIPKVKEIKDGLRKRGNK